MSAPVTLPQISYTAPGFDTSFMASLHEYGFAAVINHPLDDDRVARIYGEWLAFFSSGEASGFRMDPVKQDGYFSLEEAEHANYLLYTSPSPRDKRQSRMPSSA